jgi:hypothetical protein
LFAGEWKTPAGVEPVVSKHPSPQGEGQGGERSVFIFRVILVADHYRKDMCQFF